MNLNGRVGQVVGPFTVNQDLCAEGGTIADFALDQEQSAVAPLVLKKMGIQAPTGTIVKINDIEVKIGKTGIYELDYTVNVRSLVFSAATTDEVIVDFVY